jgi:hypothetical protein
MIELIGVCLDFTMVMWWLRIRSAYATKNDNCNAMYLFLARYSGEVTYNINTPWVRFDQSLITMTMYSNSNRAALATSFLAGVAVTAALYALKNRQKQKDRENGAYIVHS